MPLLRPSLFLLACALASVLVAGGGAGQQSSVEGEGEADPRSTELASLDCRSEVGRRAVTLFANGTLRLREGPPRGEEVRLLELGEEDLTAYLNRLAAEDLGETDSVATGAEGPWVEHCKLVLALPNHAPRHFAFDRYASLSLALSRVVAVLREMEDKVDSANLRERTLREGYVPARGDVLERPDGARFRVVGFTGDKKGIELEGLDQPITMYVALDQVPAAFSAILFESGHR